MKLTQILLIITFSLIALCARSQNANQVIKRGPADSYSRSSMSYLLLDFPNDRYSDLIRDAASDLFVPTKFDNNNINTKDIDAPYSHSNYANSIRVNKIAKIGEALKRENYAAKIMKYWWKVKEDSSFSTELIQKRGLYNASDEDVYRVDATKAGRSRLADAGLKLLGNSYVMVFDFHDIKTKREIYDEIDARARAKAKKNSTTFEPVERTQNGFEGRLTSYLFKLNYSDTIQGYLDESFIDENKVDIAKFEQIFNHVSSPYKFIMRQTVSTRGVQPNPGEPNAPARQRTQSELMKILVRSGVSETLEIMDRVVSAFRVQSSVSSSYPVMSKIGRKEGVRHERKFIVWEYVENNRKNVAARRIGTVRARRVVDNRNDELGQTQESEFYQIGGRRIDVGMTLQEKKDAGVGLSLGFGSLGLDFQVDFNVGQFVDIPVRQLKVYGQAVITGNDYKDVKVVDGSTMEPEGQYSELKVAGGFLKEYPILRGNLRVGWKAGFGYEQISWAQDENNPYYNEDRSNESISALGVVWGVNAGMNLFSPSLHLIGSLGGFHFFNASYDSGIKDVEKLELNQKSSDIFPEKKSIHMSLSLRLSF